jgi:type I restriction enzyme S subunit
MWQRREAVTVAGSFGDWTPITVHLTGEISARDRTALYKGAMFAGYPGDIVFSKIDARSGAIGVLRTEIEKAVVTAEFPVFIPDPERLDGEFVKLVLRTGGFLAALRMKASGTSGRKRITPEVFLDLRIPLPSLTEQQAIAAAYRAALDKAAGLEGEGGKTETKATAAFDTALGFGPPTPLPDRTIFVAAFKDIDRWSHEGILRRIVEGDTAHTSPWPTVQLRDVIADLENGWSPKCHDRPAAPDEWGVLKLGAVSFGVFDVNENKALPKQLKPRPHLEVETGQILISRANITRLVGATALVGETRNKLMLCDKIFRVVPLDPSPVGPAFLTEVLRISDVRRQIESNVTGTSPTMKNISKPALMGLTFPLPPKGVQFAMVEALGDARARAGLLRGEAQQARAQAWTDFEAAVYAAEDIAEALAASRFGAKGGP